MQEESRFLLLVADTFVMLYVLFGIYVFTGDRLFDLDKEHPKNSEQ